MAGETMPLTDDPALRYRGSQSMLDRLRDTLVRSRRRANPAGEGEVLSGGVEEAEFGPSRSSSRADRPRHQGPYLAVRDIDQLYAVAKAAGAASVTDLGETDRGQQAPR